MITPRLARLLNSAVALHKRYSTLPPQEFPYLMPRFSRRQFLVLSFLTMALFVHGCVQSALRIGSGGAKDFRVMYEGTKVALEGNSPYRASLTFKVVEQAGFFYPPQSFLIFGPFARLPWHISSWCWVAFLTLCTLPGGLLCWAFGRQPGKYLASAIALVLISLMNPLTEGAIALGQTALLITCGVSLGQYALERNMRWPGVFAWSIAAVKPHLALPFVAAIGILHGWRRLRDLLLAILLLNLAGCLLTTRSLSTLLDYINYIGVSHLHVLYNRVQNDQIVSWNRLYYVLSGEAIDLKAWAMVAGLSLWGALVTGRSFLIGSEKYSPALWVAHAAVGALLCVQAHGYDMVLLVMLAPHILWLKDHGYRKGFALLSLVILLTMIPRSFVSQLVSVTNMSPQYAAMVMSYRAWVVLIVALYLLIRGQPRPFVGEPSVPAAALKSAGERATPP